MKGALVAIAFILGMLLLAVGLAVTTLPLLSTISVSLPWLVLGGACLIAGAVALWQVRNWASAPGASEPRNTRLFFVVLGLFNVVVSVASVSARAAEGRGLIWGVAALGIGLLVIALARQPSK